MALPKIFAGLPARYVATTPCERAYEHAAMLFLTTCGCPVTRDPSRAADVCGNLQQESQFNPRAHRANDAGPGNSSDGIEQDNRSRRTNMIAHVEHVVGKPYAECTDPELLWGQLSNLIRELQTTQRAAAQILAGPWSSERAGHFGKKFEGFGTASEAARNSKAAAIWSRFKTAAA